MLPAHREGVPGRGFMAITRAYPDPPLPINSALIPRARGTADVALLVRIAQGDATAFEPLYDNFAGTMFSLVVRIVGSRVEAEDVLQVGFQQVWLHASDYDAGRGSPFAWIATIMRYKAIDALRARCGHRQRIDTAFQQRNEEPETAVGSEQLVLSEQHTAVREALALLGVHERKSIELAFFDGLTHLEIAQALGDPVGTVKARIRRGMLKLRRALATCAVFPIA